jgi:hypothetical protein
VNAHKSPCEQVKEEREMHASTVAFCQKRNLRYIPIYDIVDGAPTKSEITTRNGEISKYYMNIGSIQKLE